MDITKLALLSLTLAAAPVFAAQPIANNDKRTIPKNVPVTINVLANDSDPDGNGISVLVDSVVQPKVGGTVTVNSDGGIYFVPAKDFIGKDVTFSYSVIDDGAQPEVSRPALVTINVVPGNLTDALPTANGRSVGAVLDQLCNALAGTGSADTGVGRAKLIANCEALLALQVNNPDAAAYAIQQISPEETLTLSKLTANASELQKDIVSNRLSQLNHGAGGSAPGRVGWSIQPKGGAAGDDSVLSKVGVFASIELEDANKTMSVSEAGFDYRANAITAGADYALSDDWFIGGALGWTANSLDYKNKDGSVDSDIYNLITYTTYNFNSVTFDLQVGLGTTNIDLSRNIVYGNPGEEFSATTNGTTSGKDWFVNFQTQYMWNRAAWTIYPRLALNYNSSKVKGYADTDAGGWDVILSDQTVNRFTLQGGFQTTYSVNTNWGVFVPNLDVNLISDIHTKQDEVTGKFAYAPSDSLSFTLGAEDPDSLYYQVGLGFSAVLPRGISTFAGVRQTLGYTDFKSTQLEAGFRMDL